MRVLVGQLQQMRQRLQYAKAIKEIRIGGAAGARW